jgi:hypothetical protein
MAEPNPFSALIPTPDNLSLRREMEFAEQSKGQSFWAQEAGRSGIKARADAMRQGVAMGPEDARAISAQNIMAGAQKRLAELVRSGTVDPLDAQEIAINEAMSGFMAAGDYESARSLLPGLNQIRMYRDEQAKLHAETRAQNASAYQSNMAGAKSGTEAAAIATKLPHETDNIDAEAAYRRAGVNERNAHASLYNRTNPNLRGGGSGGAIPAGVKDLSKAEIRDQHEGLAGTFTLFNTMSDLVQIVEQSPASLSAGASAHNVASQYVKGIASYFKQKGGSMGGFESLSTDPAMARNEDGSPSKESPKTIAAKNRTRINVLSQTLGVDRTILESVIIDAAYALARANDPGGRLSNNDFDQAIKMLGAVQDPEAAKAAFLNNARRTYDKHQSRMRSLGTATAQFHFGEQMLDVDNTYKALSDRFGVVTKEPKSGATQSKGEWTVINGIKVRAK